MDYYTCIFLIPKTGNRIIIDGVSAEVNIINNFATIIEPSGYIKKTPKGTSLEIILEVSTLNTKQYEKMSKLLINNKLFLHFKDTHPNLISGHIRSITADQHITTIKFDGNTIDKTYQDYIVDISDQLKETLNWQEPELPEPDPGFKKKIHFRKKDNK